MIIAAADSGEFLYITAIYTCFLKRAVSILNRSAYLFFCEEERPKVKETQPELSMTEISKVLGALWSSISDKQKEKFVKMAAEDKDRYAKEMAEYKENSSGREDSKKQRELVK